MDGHCRLISSKRGAGRYFSDALLNIFGSSLSSDWGHPTGVKYRNPTSISQFHIVNNIIRVTYNVAGIYKAGRIWGLGFTPKVIWAIVKANAKSCGLPSVAPHHLRRTCARLCHQAGGELDQIQFLLGHVSIQTTERYLGCKQRFHDAVNDHIGLEPDAPS